MRRHWPAVVLLVANVAIIGLNTAISLRNQRTQSEINETMSLLTATHAKLQIERRKFEAVLISNCDRTY